jgi:hypothetical protein
MHKPKYNNIKMEKLNQSKKSMSLLLSPEEWRQLAWLCEWPTRDQAKLLSKSAILSDSMTALHSKQL